MSHPWLNELWRFVALNILALMIGLVLGQVAIVLLIAFVLYFIWHIYHLYQLERWIVSRDTTSPPNARGIWGDVFYHIYKLQRRNRKRKKSWQTCSRAFRRPRRQCPMPPSY